MGQLEEIARAIVAPGKGILAADESSGTIKKRFDSIGVESTEENRRDYREFLFRTAGAEDFISGVILFDETIRQKAADGTPLVKLLKDAGIIPGIKVDTGAKELAGAPGEKVTEGLDGLRERLAEYVTLGAGFAKWRAVITIGDGIPSDYCIETNAHALARYAALCVEAGLVPIVEPEVLMDGGHTLERCYEVTERTLEKVFGELYAQRVPLEQILLKPNMVLSGSTCSKQASVREVAEATLHCFHRSVPAAVPGCVFLSGSYGRALQAPALKAWGGKTENVKAAQQAYFHRAKCNGAARSGSYTDAMEAAA
jgi:fructose-bisphosphate aldolase class I